MEHSLIKQKISQYQTLDKVYSVDEILIGFVITKTNNKSFEKIYLNPKPKMLKYMFFGYYQDIETGQCYLSSSYRQSDATTQYISDKHLYNYKIYCREALIGKDYNTNSKLTIKQLREIVSEQEINKEMYFS